MSEAKSICVFCGSKKGEGPAYMALAQELGAAIGARGMRLVYGGGRIGLMGAVAEATHAAGGKVTGVIPEFLMRLEVGNAAIGTLEITDSMHSRKRRMFELADAFVTLPGGLGTLDETFEIVTWKQLRLHDKPIVVLSHDGFWQPLETLVSATIDGGFAHPAVKELFTVVDSVEAVFKAIAEAPPVKAEVLTSHL